MKSSRADRSIGQRKPIGTYATLRCIRPRFEREDPSFQPPGCSIGLNWVARERPPNESSVSGRARRHSSRASGWLPSARPRSARACNNCGSSPWTFESSARPVRAFLSPRVNDNRRLESWTARDCTRHRSRFLVAVCFVRYREILQVYAEKGI